MNRTLPLLFILTGMSSCGITSKYRSSQDGVFARDLTEAEKQEIAHKGEIVKDIQYSGRLETQLLQGRLRVLKTARGNVFNFVEVGRWVDHGKTESSWPAHNVEFRDTIDYDINGTVVEKKIYTRPDKDTGVFELTEHWTSEMANDSFVEHAKLYTHGTLVAEYFGRVPDYRVARHDTQKSRIRVGVHKEWYTNGQLKAVRTYDQQGVLLHEEKYEQK